MNYFIGIGVSVILELLSEGVIPQKYVAKLLKLRNALNLAFPPDSNAPAAHVQIV